MESFDEERAPDVCRSRDDRGPEMDGQAAIDRFAPPTRPASVTSPVSPRPAASAHDPNAADSQPTSRDTRGAKPCKHDNAMQMTDPQTSH